MGIKNFSRSQYDAVVHPEKMGSGQLSRTRWALAIFVIVLVVGAGILVVTHHQKQAAPTTRSAPVPTLEYTPGSTNTTAGCLDNTDKDISATAPVTSQWVATAAGQMPEIQGAGPCGKPVGGVSTGFAKTQSGALSAAVHWAWELFTSPVTTATPGAIRAIVIPGSDRDGLVAQANRVLSGAQAPDPDYRNITQVAGYKIQVQGDTTLVDIGAVSQVGAEKLNITTRVTLRWEDGDWKVVPAGSDAFSRGARITDFSGFVPFSAEVSNEAG